MLVKSENKEHLCLSLVGEILSEPGMGLVVVGPACCLRLQYFRARQDGCLKNFFMFQLDSLDIALHSHIPRLKKMLGSIVMASPEIKGLILYLSCGDVLSGTDYRRLCREVELGSGVLVRAVTRGPLGKRKSSTRDRVKQALEEIRRFPKRSKEGGVQGEGIE